MNIRRSLIIGFPPLFPFFKTMNGIPPLTKEFKFPLCILRSVPKGRSTSLSDKQDHADGDETHSQRQFAPYNTIQISLALQPNPFFFQSHSVASPASFTLPVASRVQRPWVSVLVSMCVQVFVFMSECVLCVVYMQ